MKGMKTLAAIRAIENWQPTVRYTKSNAGISRHNIGEAISVHQTFARNPLNAPRRMVINVIPLQFFPERADIRICIDEQAFHSGNIRKILKVLCG